VYVAQFQCNWLYAVGMGLKLLHILDLQNNNKTAMMMMMMMMVMVMVVMLIVIMSANRLNGPCQ